MNLTDFVVGRGDAARTIHCEIVIVEDTPNVRLDAKYFESELRPGQIFEIDARFPPLNINGLRRLSRHLSALADLLENSRPTKAAPPQETVDALVDRVLARRRKEKA
jgi:hypothetical protein